METIAKELASVQRGMTRKIRGVLMDEQKDKLKSAMTGQAKRRKTAKT